MLDLAFGLTDTYGNFNTINLKNSLINFFKISSRLGCQIVVTEKMEGWVLTVPKEVSDARG